MHAATGPTVLVVDDEPMVREVVARYLERDGVVVHEAGSGDDALAWLRSHRPDLVVLDVMLPGVDGLDVLRQIRSEGDVPVILLTARTDDYVVKPFSPRELAVRVRNVLRRAAAAPSSGGAALRFGPLQIDPAAREVAVDGRPVLLTPKEFDLLAVLARSPRQVFSRRQLLEQVWYSGASARRSRPTPTGPAGSSRHGASAIASSRHEPSPGRGRPERAGPVSR